MMLLTAVPITRDLHSYSRDLTTVIIHSQLISHVQAIGSLLSGNDVVIPEMILPVIYDDQ